MIRVSASAVTTALGACRRRMVVSRDASVQRAVIISVTLLARRPSAAPTVNTTPASVNCVAPRADSSGTSTRNTTEHAVRIAFQPENSLLRFTVNLLHNLLYNKLYEKSTTNRKSSANTQQVVQVRIRNQKPTTNPQYLDTSICCTASYTTYCPTSLQ